MHKHTNRLANETSPYLLQHAHNPVDWFPWGEEAFAIAQKSDKPILVSIGYSACHWCHVMERESFENEQTAEYMNEHFINIKIDREERPDIDQIYMDAVQAMTGSGGWPLNVFLLNDKRPFFGGTYYPPLRAFNRGSWQETLQAVSTAFKERKNELESQAENLVNHIKSSNVFGLATNAQQNSLSLAALNEICDNILANADKVWGGFGRAPKFPQTMTVTFLLRHYHFTKDDAALNQALLSLDKMIYGGIYDQIGGGFARYSTDEKWLAPHFEKMLYDNALLLTTLCEAWQLAHKPLYAKIIRQTLAFVQRELTNEDGGFFSALDADSEGVEGKFYTWSKQEVDEILGQDSPLFCEYYNVTDAGNWEHTNILWITEPLDEFIRQNNGVEVDNKVDEYEMLLEVCKNKLLQQRSKRIRPGLDDKILLSWNALMNIAFSKAAAALADPEYKEMAVKNMNFLEKNFFSTDTGEWRHSYKNQMAKYPAFLEDYAYLIQAYIHLQELTGVQEYLLKAKRITEIVLEHFSDKEEIYFFFTHEAQHDVIVRKKDVYDGATPSGNSMMAHNLLYLSKVFDKADWHSRAGLMLQGLQASIVKYPASFGNWAMAYQNVVLQNNEIAVVGMEAAAGLTRLLQHYIPNKVLQWTTVATGNDFPLLADKPFNQRLKFYLCKNYSCLQPVDSVNDLVTLINQAEEDAKSR